MIRLICGITPEDCTLRQKISAYPASETTPSWMRAPPESLMPITGQPNFAARSITLQIFSANTSLSEPPKTVKSCEKSLLPQLVEPLELRLRRLVRALVLGLRHGAEPTERCVRPRPAGGRES